MFSSPLPVWRSLLYVPAHVPRYVAKAEVCGADAVILDLEDGVPPEQKAQARGALVEAIPRLARIGYDVLVRVNGPLEPMAADLRAAVLAGASGVVLPKVRGAAHLEAIDEQLALLEDESGAPLGRTRIIAIIETPRAFEVMSDIARATPRIAALMLGGGDFALSCDSRASAEVLRVPKQLLVIAARAAGVLPLGLTGGLDVLDDLDAFERAAQQSVDMGFAGATCIHPAQVAVLNRAFMPSAEEVSDASALLAAFDAARAEGRGALRFDGRMVDAPGVTRARRVLVRHAASQRRMP
ncbi:HpcH/HpaI aldolase/citrate lyase family protein [Ralstonia sp. 24A2]|uniref:HpcH/HpaI aldolase/citrate lyase family protein n=1 Tax=Ralstonia sp. 24A2 TaxID=3447364 RepID=UPI003F69A41C